MLLLCTIWHMMLLPRADAARRFEKYVGIGSSDLFVCWHAQLAMNCWHVWILRGGLAGCCAAHDAAAYAPTLVGATTTTLSMNCLSETLQRFFELLSNAFALCQVPSWLAACTVCVYGWFALPACQRRDSSSFCNSCNSVLASWLRVQSVICPLATVGL